MTWNVIEGDCVEQMKLMDEASVDAIVTDPPAGISFMGRGWDSDRSGGFVAWLASVMEEALRVTKPGGHALVWALPRTSHWTGSAIEAAGWEIRDRITHHFGSGFPKSLDVSKAIDRLNGKPLERMREFGVWMRSQREAAGLTAAEVNRKMEMPQGCGWWEGKGAGDKWDLHPPSLETFAQLKKLYKAGDDWDWFVEWAEAEREKVGENPRKAGWFTAQDGHDVTAPATPEAQRWQGWGTALKPATEDWWLARKPLIGTVAQNVERFGTGALAIDRCRIGSDQITVNGYRSEDDPELHAQRASTMFRAGVEREPTQHTGRWPANVALSHLPECERVGERRVKGSVNHHVSQTSIGDGKTYQGGAERTGHDYVDEDGLETVEAWSCAPGCPVAELDRQSGERPTGGRGSRGLGIGDGYGGSDAEWDEPRGYDDSAAGASRFFYVAKSSRSERNAGLEGFEAQHRPNGNKWTDRDYRVERGERTPGRESGPRQNVHPTVKPVDLMRWLVRLVTPPDGLVLDPFAGSGTTGIACVLEDFDFIGIEREPDYVEIAKARIDYWAKQPKQLDLLGDAA